MSKYQNLLDIILTSQIKSSKSISKNNNEMLYRDIINQLKLNHKQIAQYQCENPSKSKLYNLLKKFIRTNDQEFYNFFKQLMELLYLKESIMLSLIYQCIPTLLTKYIESQEVKNSDLQGCIKLIYTNQVQRYNRFIKQREEINSTNFVKDLYSIHFGKNSNFQLSVSHSLDKSMEIQESQVAGNDRKTIKAVLFYLIYRNISSLYDENIQQFLKLLYLYCGGDLKTLESISSIYMLEKKNMFNLFRYTISQQQLQWIIISLYESSIQKKNYKFELLAAINMIHKKTANESMFKYSEITQSIIHLLQDEYSDIFS